MDFRHSQTAIALRSPDQVMTLARIGSFHQSRLSFMRVLLRHLKSRNWQFERPIFEIDKQGVGIAVYTARGPAHSYSLVAFANDLSPEKRSDRVIATEWDATFTLFDGVPSRSDIARLERNVPKQEAGRVSKTELAVSRANRSVRLWAYVIDCLARGTQPSIARIDEVGYLMRTTAVYGSGKLGAADRDLTADRPEFRAPFQIEMLSVYLIRGFVIDLVEHMARLRAPGRAVAMEPTLRRRFGIGNSTGLGMAPFLINHPVLFNNWIKARETALARVRGLKRASPAQIAQFCDFAIRARENTRRWSSAHPIQIEKQRGLRADMDRLCAHLAQTTPSGDHPWNRLWLWAQTSLGLEGQEQLVSLLLEPYGALIDDLSDSMAADEAATMHIDGRMRPEQLRSLIEDVYSWALATDWSDPATQAGLWYVSEEKSEPRLGCRSDPGLAGYEQPLSPGRDAARMYQDLLRSDATTVGEFLMRHPEHRHMARRAQIAARFPYAEIRDNTIAADMRPIDMLRAKLSFFGACHFDPRSDRWLRINMFQHAPLPGELPEAEADDWTMPPASRAG